MARNILFSAVGLYIIFGLLGGSVGLTQFNLKRVLGLISVVIVISASFIRTNPFKYYQELMIRRRRRRRE